MSITKSFKVDVTSLNDEDDLKWIVPLEVSLAIYNEVIQAEDDDNDYQVQVQEIKVLPNDGK